MKFIRGFILLIFLGCSLFSLSQPNQQATHVNGWFMYTGSHAFANKWSLHLEAQWRRHDIITNPKQLLLRTGINYHINSSLFVTAGYGYIITYPYGEFPVRATFPEHRIWEQLQYKNVKTRIEWISRLRIEQRFNFVPVLTPSLEYEPGDAVYTNRFRWLNRFSIPFKGKAIKSGSFYFSAYDEVFLNAGKNVGSYIFDQNRTYAAIGYSIKSWRIELGYLHHLIARRQGAQIETNHTLQVGVFSTIRFKK